MKTWMKIALALLILGIIGAFLTYKFVYNKQHPDYGNIKAAYSMQALELYKSYKSHPESSATLYNGKMISLTGKLSKVETADSLVTAVFIFNQGDFGDEGIRCTMLKNNNEEALRLQPDGDVSIKGYCTGFNETDVILEKCTILINY